MNIELQSSLFLASPISEFSLVTACILSSDLLNDKVIRGAILLNGKMTIFGINITTVLCPFNHRLRTAVAWNANRNVVLLEGLHIVGVVAGGLGVDFNGTLGAGCTHLIGGFDFIITSRAPIGTANDQFVKTFRVLDHFESGILSNVITALEPFDLWCRLAIDFDLESNLFALVGLLVAQFGLEFGHHEGGESEKLGHFTVCVPGNDSPVSIVVGGGLLEL